MPECRLATVAVTEIATGDRARKDYKDVVSLATDIKRRGLIHPIAVMEKEEGGYLLLAGGRRLVACKHGGISEIDCKIFPSSLTGLEIKSIELMENVMREDLDFHDKVFLEREIFQLQQEIHGIKISTSPDAPGVSQTDVAHMMGISRETLRKDIELADTIDKFPAVDWKSLKNQAEAIKVKDGIGKIVVRQEAVRRFEQEVPVTQKDRYRERLVNSYVVGDFFERVKDIPDNCINLVEIDPPYAIDIEKQKKTTGPSNYSYGEEGYNEIEADEYYAFLLQTFQECYRTMTENSWLICWFAPEPWFNIVLIALRTAKLNVRGLPCYWIKGDEAGETTSGQTNTPIRHLANAAELFFYAKKGDPRINRQGRTNVFGHKPVPAKQKIHPTERPLPLMEDILTTFTSEGSRILVPFAGSGNTIISAYENKMTCIGFDLGQLHKDAYVTRLTQTIAN